MALNRSLIMVAVVVTVAVLGVHLGVLVTCNLYEVVPVHDGPNLVLEAVLLLDFLRWCCDDALILNLLTGAFSAVIKQGEARLLCLVLPDLILLDCPLFLLADPAHVQLLCLNLATFLDFLLVGENQEFLRH